MIVCSLLIFIQCSNIVFSANILYITPLASPSHHLWNRRIALALVERGHNVTMLTHDQEKGDIPKNWTIILLEGVYDKLWQSVDYVQFAKDQASQKYVGVRMVYDWQDVVISLDFKTHGLKTLLNYPEDYKFDLIIFDPSASQSHYPLIDRFGRPPVVAVTPFLLPHYLSSAMGNHIYPSYMPHYLSEMSNTMSFTERFHNFIFFSYEIYVRRYEYMITAEETARKFYGDKYVRPLHEYEDEFAVLLCNYDPLMDYSVALPPNVIAVGGLHTRPGEKLPDDLREVFENAKDGVVLFTLGTNLKSNQLNEELRKDILSVFGKLKQTVIWKFESDIGGLPKNVIARKWLPQNDMMAHPNLKLLITHGGALTVQEAMYHGVPVVVLPFFADQIANAQRMSSKNLGRTLKFSEFNKNDFYEVIKDVVNNATYEENARKLSRLIKDQQQTPLEKAVYWIERTLKFGRIDNLRLPTTHMSLIQIYNLDVIFVLIGIIVIPLLILAIIIKNILHLFKSTKNTKSKLKSQ